MSTVAQPAHSPTEPVSTDDLSAVLEWHAGDSRAAIITLLEDCKYLREQLAVTEAAMSSGFTRGWKPAFDRD